MFKFKRVLAMMLAFIMTVSMISVAPSTEVNAAPSKYVKSLSLSKSKLTIESGKTAKIKATVKVKGKASTKVKVSLSKSNKKVVKKAKVGSPKKGVSTITFTAANVTSKKTTTIKVVTSAKNSKNKTITKNVKVTVKPAPTPTTEAPTTAAPTIVLPTTEQPTTQQPTTEQPTEQPTAKKLENINVTADTTSIVEKGGQAKLTVTSATEGVAIARVEYESSNEQIATVKNGVVTGVNANSAAVIIKVIAYDANGNKVEKTIAITVTEKKSAKISLDVTESTLFVGQEKTLKATVTEADADAKVLWSSSDESVVKVTDAGVVTAVADGNATVTATVQGTTASATCAITVKSEAPGVEKVEATHADTLVVYFTAPVIVDDQDKVVVSISSGVDKLTPISKTWAKDGMSIEFKFGELAAGNYNVELSGDNVTFDPNKKTASTVVEERKLSDIKIKTKYIPHYSKAKIDYDALDQYGDVMQNVVANQFTWTIASENVNVNTMNVLSSISNKGYIIANVKNALGLDPTNATTNVLKVSAYLTRDNTIRTTEYVTVNNLKVASFKITGVVDDVVYSSSVERTVELEYEAIDTMGGKVDLEALADSSESAYNNEITYTSSDYSICNSAYIDEDKLKVDIMPNAVGKATLTINVDGTLTNYTIDVKEAPKPAKVDFTKAAGMDVVAKEAVKLPVDIYDQYGNQMDVDVLAKLDLNAAFTFKRADNTIGVDENNSISFAVLDGVCYVVVDTKNAKDKGDVTVIVGTGMKDYAEYKLPVKAERAANKIDVTKVPAKAIMVGQSTTIEFIVKDAYDQLWDESGYIVEVLGNNEYISVSDAVIDKGIGYITIKGTASTEKATTQKVSISLKTADGAAYITTSPIEYGIVVNPNVDTVAVTTDKKEYRAGQKVVMTLTAKNDDITLTTYNETINNVKVYMSNEGKDVYQNVETVTFVNGVATIEVDARIVEDNVTYYGSFVSPGKNEATEFETAATVKIVPGEAHRIDTVMDADGKLTLTYRDSMGNVVKDMNGDVNITLSLSKDDEMLAATKYYVVDTSSRATVTFENGIGSIALKNGADVPVAGVKITVKSGDLTGDYTVK